MKRLWRIPLIVLIGLSWLPVMSPKPIHAATPIWAPPPLAEIIEEGLNENKEIQSLEAQVASLEQEIPLAGSLEDLRLGFAVLNLPTDTWSFDQEAMTKKEIFIAQKVPWFGKLSLKSQRQTLAASRQQWMLEARRLELARQIATTYYSLGFNGSSLENNERLTALVSQLLKVAETRYAAGEGLQQDVLEAQVELSNLLDERIVLKRQRRTLEDQINELLNREKFTPIQPPRNLPYPDLKLDVKNLRELTLRQNPQLGARQAKVDQTGVEIKLAKKEYWPDMDFKVAYGQRNEDFTGRDLPDLFSAGVTISVPLWFRSRQNSQLGSAIKRRQAATKSYSSLTSSLPHQVDALITEIRDFQKNYRLFADALVLQADQWARSALAAYQVGKVEFNTMINAHIRLLRFELQAERYLFSIYEKRAELEEILGGPIPQ
ncbi:MAG: TolC family protein [Deltaproteobacteria bacterium]|nr:MAG: TolC family protein [Deltaproteobacteria bacterium]